MTTLGVIPDSCQFWDTIALFSIVKVHVKCKKGLEISTPPLGGGLSLDIVYILTLPDKDSIKI